MPPGLNIDSLLASARNALSKEWKEPPENASPQPIEAGHVIFFALGDGASRATVIAARGPSIDIAWQQGAVALQARAKRATLPPKCLRVEIVDTVTALSWGELKAKLAQTKRNYFNLGIAFDAHFKHALLAQEMQGAAVLYSGEVEHALPNLANLRLYAKRRFGAEIDFPSDDTAPVWCFTTRAVYVDAAGAWPITAEGQAAGFRRLDDWNARQVRALIDSASDYLAEQVKPTGEFHYGWFPCFDRAIPTYNTLRHASTTYAMLEAWELTRSATQKAAIDRSLGILTQKLIRQVPLPDGAQAALLVDVGNEVKLGGNAVCLLALVKYTELTGDRQYMTLMEQLALGIRAMQDQKSGRFVHVLNFPKLDIKDAFRVIYYDGEAAFGLMRLYGLTRDERWLAVVEKAFDHFIAAKHWQAHDHWLSYCVNELTRYRPETRYYQFGLQNVAGYLDFVLERITTFPTLLELMMAAREMVLRIDADPALRPLLDGLDREKFDRALEHRARYLANGHFWPELAMFFRNPDRVVGSFFIKHHSFRVRIDDVEHYLSGYVAYLKLLQGDATTSLLPPADGPVVAWGGDVNLGRRQHYRTQELGLASVLGGVPVLAEADLRIVNLECVVSTLGAQGVEKDEATPYYYRARPEMLRVLTEANIEVVATANNHSGDYGVQALLEQARLLDAAGIGHAGTGATLEAALKPVLRRVGMLNVALFVIDATQPRFAASQTTGGSAYLPLSAPSAWLECLAPRIAAVRAQAHVVLVAVHWGRNQEPAPGGEEIAVGHAIIEAGADAVLGASAHMLQGVEIHQGRPIVHDAGDFLFDAIRRDDDEGGVFSLQLTEDGVRRVMFTPIGTGFGQTVQLEGERATASAGRFLQKCADLGSTAFTMAPTGQCVLELQPPPRAHQALPALPPTAIRPEAIQPVAAPREEWCVDAVPPEAKLASPLSFGPLRLLGVQATPKAIEGRQLLFVETFWQADEPIDSDWRLDIRAVPVAPATMPSWGAAMDHDPCDWMWPTSRWQPGVIYRDYYGLRPPAGKTLHDAQLQLVIGIVGAAGRSRRVPVAAPISFAVRKGKATQQPVHTYPPPPQYRATPPDLLPPDLPDVPGQTWNAAQVAAATGGTWLVEPPPGWFVRSVPRSETFLDLLPGPSLFVVSGEPVRAMHERYPVAPERLRWDWSKHVARFQPRLAGAVVSEPIEGLEPDFPVLQVADPIHALIELGATARQRLRGRVVAITGSAGKTSVCRMLAHAFAASHRVFSTMENYNSRVGMLAMLANVSADTDLVVLETAVSGINAPDFQNIKLVQPDLAIVTNIAPSHLGEGQTVLDIARRKANIFEGMRPGGIALLCTDTDHFDYLLRRAQARRLVVLTYGEAAFADIRLEAHDPESGKVTASHRGQTFSYGLGAKGRHMAINSLACFAVARALALDEAKVPTQLASFAAVAGRGQLLELSLEERRFRLIDETYNANPLSMAMALAMMASEPCANGRKVLVLGDMLELGSDAARYHEELVAHIVQCEPALVFLRGPHMRELSGRLAAALPKTSRVHAPETLADLQRVLFDAIEEGDLLLLKGSNGMQLWQLVHALARLQRPAPPAPPAVVIRRVAAPPSASIPPACA
ncbi:UDP-N-acetylmuramoyl-tripeptide--D-alanyl-D-alanine ligase [Variovorax boronicumulans]|uniref:CapA family protein n=1 Tax=Variovorax boronicumulans TaxID=436515 RepID=UPI002787F075|nr:CapA family protein [Variovorax boronicumulans]MDQ0037992.1 UDP-N-acetylmuramoyl-tripeptide--D-alanyl-D-alanine ligase [Variovorax boronicumulans]